MRPTDIPWADLGWSPIVGCVNNCEYCYARKRVAPRLAHLCKQCGEFVPHLHTERLHEPLHVQKPALVFADPFADWWSEGVKRQWRADTTTAMADAPQHRFVILTKAPERITKWDIEYWPPNAWLGVSITSGADWWRWEALARLPSHIHMFISFEPLFGTFDEWGATVYDSTRAPEWYIAGPQSKPHVPVDRRLQQSLRDVAGRNDIPLFEKPGLPLQPPIRQMPAELKAVFRKGGLND